MALQRCRQDGGELGRWDSVCHSITYAVNIYMKENSPVYPVVHMLKEAHLFLLTWLWENVKLLLHPTKTLGEWGGEIA